MSVTGGTVSVKGKGPTSENRCGPTDMLLYLLVILKPLT